MSEMTETPEEQWERLQSERLQFEGLKRKVDRDLKALKRPSGAARARGGDGFTTSPRPLR